LFFLSLLIITVFNINLSFYRTLWQDSWWSSAKRVCI